MKAFRKNKWRKHLLPTMVLLFLSVSSSACSVTNNSGSCDAQGGNNGVTCQGINSGEATPDNSANTDQSSTSAPAPAQATANDQPTPTVSPLSTNIRVLKPTSDPGFNLIWRGKLSINAAGVRIASSGVYPASPEDWDLAYQSGNSDVKWHVNNQTSEDPAIFSYTGSGTPGPAWCRRAFTSDQLTGTGTAEPGDRDCYIDLHGIVGYFQVISVGSNGPIVTAWFWNGPPP